MVNIKCGQFITDIMGGKKYKLLTDADAKGMGYKLYRAKVQDEKNKIFFIKFTEIDRKNYYVANLKQREGNFCFYYPYIEHVYGGFEGKTVSDEKVYCVLLEYIEGWNLEEYCKEQGNEEDFELRMFGQMLQILYGVRYYMNFSTRDPFLHRDLKPANIMITKKEGRAVIVDFDYVHVTGSRDTMDMKAGLGLSMGYTEPKIAEEHIKGRRIQEIPGIQSDIYALGRTFCYWIKRKPYYEEENGEEENKKKKNELMIYYEQELAYGVDMSRFEKKYRGALYKKFFAMLGKMCAAPEERYRNVDDIIKDMKVFLSEYCKNSDKWYMEFTGMEKMPLLQKPPKVERNNVRNVLYKKSWTGEGKRGRPLYSGKMRDILDNNGALIMTIYNLDGKIYFIPYAMGLKRIREGNDFEIRSGDKFMYRGENITFFI